jgi:RHS repeat-associated protein
MAPDGRINSDHPLMPRQPGDRTEWATNSPQGGPGESGCGQNPNSRTGVGHRLRTPDAGGAPAEATTGGTWPFGHSYDAAGNLRCDGKHVFTYDGSNRLKDVYVPDMTTSPYDPTPGTRVAHFDYDGLGRQVRSVYNTDGDTSLDDEDVEWTPRDLLGRPIGIWRQGPVSEGSRPCAKPYQFFGYNSTGFRGTGYDASGGILDCPVVRWRDTDNDGTLDETLYYLQDLRGDITALLDPVSQDIVERVRYGPTGRPEAFPAADVNFDGKVDGGDKDAFEAALDAFTSDPANYDPRADLDRDGDVDAKDEELFFAGYGKFGGLSGNWKLSQGDGLTPGGTGADAGLDNRFGWRGYWYDSHLQKYHVRNRVYDPREGQWLQTDPIGFGAGDQNLYRYCGGEYSMGYDPLGLNPWGDIAMYVAGKVFPGIAIIESIRAGHIPGVPGIEMTTDGYRAAENNARHNGEQRPSVFDVLNSILVTALGGANAITGYSGYDPYNDRLVTGFERVLRTIVGTGEYFASAILPLLGELVAAEAAKGKGALPEPEPAPRPRLRSPQEEETCRREGEIDKYLKERGETPGSPNQRQGEQGAGRQGDRTGSNEYKSLNPGATAKTIINRVRNSVDEGGQARNITFDARGSGLSESEAREGIARSLGNYGPGGARGHRLDSIRVIGDGYDTGPVGQP